MSDNENLEIKGATAWVVHPFVKNQTETTRSQDAQVEEAVSLCDAIYLDVVGSDMVPLNKVNPSTYIGKGKMEALAELAQEEGISLFVFNCTLSPIQQRELERGIKAKVIDRTALILEIFGERARTKEGVLQVELAALSYQKSRLVRSWTHLERQRGGHGFVGGPGERQIESDRRVIDDRIVKIKKQLETVTKTRMLHRKNRSKVPYPIVALVGYTNAGKSTLFNHLTNSKVFAEDLLFATLDPTMRELKLPSGRKVILSDTVGFISDLPTQLIAAFRATLEEVVHADMILQVRDIQSEDTTAQKQDVMQVLTELGVDDKLESASLEVLNKADLLDSETRDRIHGNKRSTNYILTSAVTGEGTEELLNHIDAFFAKAQQEFAVTLPASEGKLIAWLHEHGDEVSADYKGDKVEVSGLLTEKHLGEWHKLAG